MVLSKKDLAVVLVIVLLVIMNIGAINNTGRKRAKEMVCLSNLHQWGKMFEMFTNDNNGYFNTGYIAATVGEKGLWMNALRPYYKNNVSLLLCPEATRAGYYYSSTFIAWSRDGLYGSSQSTVGSYGINGWTNRAIITSVGDTQQYWKNVRSVQGKNNIPVFLDSTSYNARPTDTDSPPNYFSEWAMGAHSGMNNFCIDRHNGGVNGLFMDWSARKIGLKELWTLKWHRNFRTWGPWTRAGGVRPERWPNWMRDFKEY